MENQKKIDAFKSSQLTNIETKSIIGGDGDDGQKPPVDPTCPACRSGFPAPTCPACRSGFTGGRITDYVDTFTEVI